MKRMLFVCLVVILSLCCAARAGEDTRCRLTLSLRDGSTVIGAADFTKIKLDAQFDGVSIPIELIREIQLDATRHAQISFRNGDRLSGTWDAKRISIESMVGALEIALTNISRIVVASAATKGVTPAMMNGAWRTGRMEGGPRAWSTATVLRDGKVLLAGGHARADDTLSSCYIFDPADESFAPTGSLLTPRHLHSASLLTDGRVLVVGGYNTTQQWLADAELYDPASGRWTPTRPRFKHGVLHSATVLPDGRVFVFGGAIGNSLYTSSGEYFDPRSDRWTPSRNQFEKLAAHSATMLPNGNILLVAGGDASGDTSAVSLLNPVEETIQGMTGLPVGRVQHAAFQLPDQRLLLAGGHSEAGRSESCFLFDINGDKWAEAPALPTVQILPATVQMSDGSVLLIGGASNCRHDAPMNCVNFFDASQGTWSEFPHLNSARCRFTAAYLHDGRVVVFGGYNGSSSFDTYEILSPETAPRTRTEPLRTTYPKPSFQ